MAIAAPHFEFLQQSCKENCIENNSIEGIIYVSQAGWATALFVPFLVNYVTTWIVWWSVDKKKTISWAAPLLSVYPQVRTLQLSTPQIIQESL